MPFVPLNGGSAFVDGDEWSLQVGDLVRTNFDDHETRIDTLEGATPTSSDSFKTIAVSGQSDVVADSATDTLTLAAGSNVTITTNASTDTVTIAASGGASDSFKTIAVSGQSDVVADSSTDTLTLVAGSNVTLTTNASTDTVTIAASASASAYPDFVDPTGVSFAWVNQGTASEASITVQGANALTMTLPDAGSGDFDMALRTISAPGTPYTVTAHFLFTPYRNNYDYAGLIFRDSSSGKFNIFGRGYNSFGGGRMTLVTAFSSATAATSNPFFDAEDMYSRPNWFRISDDGTDRKYWISSDGVNWQELYTEGRTVTFTADQIGYGANRRNVSTPHRTRYHTLLSWEVA